VSLFSDGLLCDYLILILHCLVPVSSLSLWKYADIQQKKLPRILLYEITVSISLLPMSHLGWWLFKNTARRTYGR